jgi:2'-5' RNA ligase
MTIYYLGNINNSDLNKAKQVLKKSITFPDKIFGIKVSPKKVDIIGDSEVGNYLIFSLQASKNLEGLRQRLEKGLPEFYKKNLPFKPHLTLGQIDPDNLNFSSEFVSRFEPDPHYGTFIDLEKIGIFCKPEDKTKGVTELYSIELCPKF